MTPDRDLLRESLLNDSCVSLEELQLFVEGKASSEIQSHVALCPVCQTESTMLQSFQNASVPDASAPDVRWVEKQVRKRSPVARSPFRGWNWALAGGLSFAVLILGIGIVRRSPAPEAPVQFSSQTEVMRAGALADFSPTGDITATPRDFHWSDVSHAGEFEVKLMQVDQSTLWSGVTQHNSIAVPDAVRALLLPHKVILWQVTARDKAAKTLSTSPVQRFRIVP